MIDGTNGGTNQSADGPGPGRGDPVVDHLGEAECLRLASGGGIGRIAYLGRYGPVVLPVNYTLQQDSIVFRTTPGSAMDEDLRTGIEGAEYAVAFEVDHFDVPAREGWSVLIQGSAHHVDSEEELASVRAGSPDPWPGTGRDRFVRIRPTHVTGRRIRHQDAGAPE